MKKNKFPVPIDHKKSEGAVIKLSSKGMNKQSIRRELKLPMNFFSQYGEAQEWFMRGRDKLAKKVSAAVVASSTESYLDRKMLVEKLNLFSEPFESTMLKTPEDAREVLSTALQHFTLGEITEGTLNAISKNCMTFIESYNQSVLQKDIAELKRMISEKPKHS